MSLTVLLLAGIAAAQQVPRIDLGRADARANESFTNIFAVHELADGRVLVTDNLETVIRVVDFRSGEVQNLGRRGSGPLEYRSATTILAGQADTALVTDNAQRRFVKVIAGRLVGTEAQPAPLRAVTNFSAPVTDGQGRMYFDVRNIDMSSSGFHEREGYVIRWTPGSTRLDTVAALPVASHAPRANEGYNPFRYRTAWGVAADGAIVLVRAEPYQVEWLAGGRRVTGPSLRYNRIRIDGAERDAERRAFNSRGRSGMRFQGPTPATGRVPVDPELRSRIPDDVFPPYKPPFIESRVLIAPTGEVWIPRAAAWDATSTILDVVGRDGRLRSQVRVPANRRVVGFGRSAVYVAAKDEFDLQWLERFPLRP
jgi:hypothetical protein